MSENRERLLDEMIRIYGFEHEVVIEFARLCETYEGDDLMLEQLVKTHKEFPQIENEDEE